MCPALLRTTTTTLPPASLGMNARYGFNPKAGPSQSTLSHRENRAALGLQAAAADEDDTSAGASTYQPYSWGPSASSSRSNTPGINQAYSQARTAEDLEGQNDEQLEGLNAKVKMLKNVCPSSSQSVLRAVNSECTMFEDYNWHRQRGQRQH